MRWSGSLAARLTLVLALLQTLVVLAGMAGWMLTSPYVSWDDVAGETATGLVVRALEASPGGAVIEPDVALAAYAAARPALRWAVLRAGAVVPGSAPDLAAALAALGPAMPREGRLAVPLGEGVIAAFTAVESAAGPVVVATAGNRFRLRDDLGTFFSQYAMQLVPMFGPAILAAGLAMPLAIRRLLRPVRAAARAAEAIELRSLDRRLDAAAVPSDLRPFLEAINRLLARLEDGVQRQRLFTANAAHELRTPVAILQARLDALPEAVPGRADLHRDVRRVTLLLDQLLAVARLGQREASLAEQVDLAALAKVVVADMAPLAIRAGRALALEPEGDAGPLPRLRGNARALEGALANLVDNALRAEPRGGTVVVQVGPGARLAVVDHGAGIALADRPFLFEPFWRKDEGSPGTGLGLAIVREVAGLHGGTVEVTETPGGGASFVLDLRRAPPTRPAVDPSSRSSRQFNRSQ